MRIIFNEKTYFSNSELKELNDKMEMLKTNQPSELKFNFFWIDTFQKLIQQSKR